MENLATHLSVFAQDVHTGAPLVRLPFYAEVGMRGEQQNIPDGPVDGRFEDYIDRAIREADETCYRDEFCGWHLKGALQQAISWLLTQGVRDQLASNPEIHDFFVRIIRAMLREAGGTTLSALSLERLRALALELIRLEAREQGWELAHDLDLATVTVQWAHPMGILATDHVGYLSFDLQRLPQNVRQGIAEAVKARQKDPQAALNTTVWLYPLARSPVRFDGLAQGRFAHDAIVVRLELEDPHLPAVIRSAGFPALQNPDLTDWRISPASFAANPAALVGEDGCETLPSNKAIQEFRFDQVVRLADPSLQAALPEALRDQVRLGLVHEYQQIWHPLGHSLGQMLYSLPLAPGESVNLAVIDWTRRDETARQEDSKLNEQLVHDQRRERTIRETVDAAIREYQRGSSFMGGGALSAGGSGSFGVIGAAAGSAFSLGGASSNSSGSRDLAASTVQTLSDNTSQASAAMREFQSTVVVRSSQAEREVIETRTVANYNHSHTLTVLYYEMLRHFRVVTRKAGLRPVVLVRMPPLTRTGAFTATELLGWRYMLEPLLLDPKLGGAFDAAARIALGEEKLKRETNKWAASTQTIDPGAKSFTKLIAQFTTTDDDTSEPVFVVLVLHDGRTFEFQCDGAGNEGTSPEFEKALPVPINWNQIRGVDVKLKDINTGGDWEVSNILITMATATGERVSILADAAKRTLDDAGGSTGLLPTIQPPPPTTTTTGPKPQRADFVSVEDDMALQSLLAHFEANRGYYLRALALRQNAVDQARRLDAIKLPDGLSLLDQVENRAIEVLGDYMVYPSTNMDWNHLVYEAVERNAPGKVPPDERLVTLPTRGVFAEAQLGHCNTSEEIDNTRFWDWQTSPIPKMAPEIAPAQPVTPVPVQPAGTTPTPFPGSLVNIVNPPAAPDPTGLTAALNVLATPNIFRDMSGRAEVADLLKRLSDNTIGIAEAANWARAIQGRSGGGGGGALGSTGLGGMRATPSQPSAVNRDLHDRMNLLDRAVDKGIMTPSAAADAWQTAVDDASPALQTVGDKYVRPATDPRHISGIVGETLAENALKAQGLTVFSDWRKHIAGTGFDMAAFERSPNPAEPGTVWIVDNKAQLRGIGDASALTGAAFDDYMARLRTFLEKTWPNKAEADLAIKAIDARKVKLVVSNGFAGDPIRFTKGLFDKGLLAFDVRLGKLFATHAEWEAAYKTLTVTKGVRVTRQRGAATAGGALMVLVSAAGAALLLRAGDGFKEVVGEVAAAVAPGVVLSWLPGGVFASLTLGLESDETSEQRAIRTLMAAIPGVESMTPEELKTSSENIKALLQNPLFIQVEEPQRPGIHLPGFHWQPSPDWA